MDNLAARIRVTQDTQSPVTGERRTFQGGKTYVETIPTNILSLACGKLAECFGANSLGFLNYRQSQFLFYRLTTFPNVVQAPF